MATHSEGLVHLANTPPWQWPDDAGAALLAVFRDPQAALADRLLAAELAGDPCAHDDTLAAELLRLATARDEPEELRGQAAISLGPGLELADIDGFDEPEDVPIGEAMFQKIRSTLRRLYQDAGAPKDVRRRALEAAVRAPEAWHEGAVRAGFATDDPDWRLTAVFCMRWISGFDAEIIAALESEDDNLQYEALHAAGNWGVDAAWPHIAALLDSPDTEQSLVLAAIDAAASIRPEEAAALLFPLTEDEDEDIAEAAHEALEMAEALLGRDWEEGDEEFDD